MEGESATWFWNESANKSDWNTEEEDEEGDEVDENGSDLDVDELRQKKERISNRDVEDKLRGAYRNGSRSTSRRN